MWEADRHAESLSGDSQGPGSCPVLQASAENNLGNANPRVNVSQQAEQFLVLWHPGWVPYG